MTGLDLIKGSLRLVGAIATGETPSASEQQDALSILNEIIESWANDGLMINQRIRETFSLIATQQTYTMGVGGDFNTSRPTQIVAAGVVKNSLEIPMYLINEQEWANILLKSTSSNLPHKLYQDGAFPLLNLNIWPVPSESNSIVLYSLKPLSAISNLSATLSLPPGYSRSLRYNLAGEISPEYGKPVDPVIAAIAAESKAEIKRQNTQPVYMKSDAMGLTVSKPFNWLTGE